MKKTVLTILLTTLIFLSTVALGVSTVFRVDEVALELTTVSTAAATQAEEIHAKLEAAYSREASFNVTREKADGVLKEYPHFRLTEFTVSYPDKLIIKLAEEGEVYAYQAAIGEYYILSGEGIVLDVRSENANRLDEGENVLLKGISATGAKGEKLSGKNVAGLLSLCKAVDGALEGIRRSVLSAEALYTEGRSVYRLTTREGVRLYFLDPQTMTREKAEKAVNEYLSLTDDERMTGRILVTDADGVAFAEYKATDEFSK